MITATVPEGITEVAVEEYNVCDQRSVLLGLRVLRLRGNKKLVTIQSTSNLNEDAIKLDLSLADCSPVYAATCVNSKWAAWLHIWNEVVDAHCPIIKKAIKTAPAPWLHDNPELRAALLARDCAHSRADKTGSADDWASFHELRRQASELLSEAKSAYFDSLLDSSRNIWPEVRKYLLQKSVPATSTQSRPSHDEEAAFADQQNLHFATTASRVAATMRPSSELQDSGAAARQGGSTVGPRPPRVVSSAFCLKPATLPELSRALLSMNNSKARGDDGVSLQMLKIVFPVIAAHLLHVINFSITSGTVPNDWKIAVVVPLHKKGSTDDPKFFRPISLLSNVSKLCEKIVVSQLTAYLIDNCILNDNQHAYLPGRSTETALAAVTAYITKHVDAKQVVSLASVDLSSAFDCVDHEILLRKLAWYGVSPAWFSDYLTNRRQRVRGGRTVQNVSAGVPQGSLTGPVLFLLYTNDIPSHLDCSIISYADDSQVLVPGKISDIPMMTARLEQNLKSLEEWYRAHHLKLNGSKTQYVIFCTRPLNRHLSDVSLSVGDAVVTPSNTLTNLGVIMDHNLTWADHVKETAQKCNKIIFPLTKHGSSLSQHVLAKMVQTLVIPHLTYCAPIWGGLCANQRQRLQKVLNRAARMTTKTARRAHITPVLHQLGWRSIEEVVKHRDAMLVHHALYSPCAPPCLRSLFIRRVDVCQRRTRAQQTALELPQVRTELAKRSLQYRAASLWNSLPHEVTNAVSRKLFRSKLPF